MIRINAQMPIVPVAPVVVRQDTSAQAQAKLNAQAAITGAAVTGIGQEAIHRDERRKMAELLLAQKQAAQKLQQEAQRVIAATRKWGDGNSGGGHGRRNPRGKQDRQVPQHMPNADDTLH